MPVRMYKNWSEIKERTFLIEGITKSKEGLSEANEAIKLWL